MKKALNVLVLGACMVLASCGGTSDSGIKTTVLEAPTNVQVVLGSEKYSSEDDVVTFDAVEHATAYQVYVYHEGDAKAKVTTGTTTSVELPTPLDAGTYNISVIAVGDGVNYKNSNGSTPIAYTLEAATITKLGKVDVSTVKMDFTTSTLSFTGVADASSYNVFVYSSDADAKEKNDSNLVTSFKVPGGDTNVSYTISDSVAADITPGYYFYTIQAMGDENNYTSDGDVVTTNKLIYGNVQYATPKITASEGENGGVKVELTNYADFVVGTKFTVNAYASADATAPVTTTTFTYTSTTSFGRTTINANGTFETKEAEGAAATDLTVGKSYYFSISLEGDGVIYTNSPESEKSSVTITKAGKISSNTGGGGFPGGGGGGGGGGGASITVPATITIDTTAQTWDITMGSSNYLEWTATKDSTPRDGCDYSYTFANHDTGWPFTWDAYLALKTGGEAYLYMAAGGPLSECKKTGTWTIAETTITVNF